MVEQEPRNSVANGVSDAQHAEGAQRLLLMRVQPAENHRSTASIAEESTTLADPTVKQTVLIGIIDSALASLNTQGLQYIEDLVQIALARSKRTEQTGCTVSRRCYAAIHAVLSDTRLLERIMACLDVEDLLLLRPVSRKWHTTLRVSMLLQRKMFLMPEEAHHYWDISHCEENDKPRGLVRAVGDADPEDTNIIETGRANELFFERDEDDKLLDRVIHGSDFLRFRDEVTNKLHEYPQDSEVGKMFVTQPPTQKIRLSGPFWQEIVENPAGVTVGDVLCPLSEIYEAAKLEDPETE